MVSTGYAVLEAQRLQAHADCVMKVDELLGDGLEVPEQVGMKEDLVDPVACLGAFELDADLFNYGAAGDELAELKKLRKKVFSNMVKLKKLDLQLVKEASDNIEGLPSFDPIACPCKGPSDLVICLGAVCGLCGVRR